MLHMHRDGQPWSRPYNRMMDSAASRVGLVLFAHGARDPRWAEPFERAYQGRKCGRLCRPLAYLN
jgi:hypothetical protein